VDEEGGVEKIKIIKSARRPQAGGRVLRATGGKERGKNKWNKQEIKKP